MEESKVSLLSLITVSKTKGEGVKLGINMGKVLKAGLPKPKRKDDGRNDFHSRTEKTTFSRFGLTVDGRPICVDEYCLRMANHEHTNVILF